MISGVHHLAIKVRDLAGCERFYTQVLGLQVLRRWPSHDRNNGDNDGGNDGDGGGDRSVWLATGGGVGTFLALERTSVGHPAGGSAPPSPSPDEGGLHLVALRIDGDQRTAWEGRLASAGVPIVHRTAYTIYFHDPEGNRLGLSHHPDARPFTAGAAG